MLRGLAHRGASTVMIFMVALVAVAAAVAGPVYYNAAKVSTLRDTLTSGVLVSRGFEANLTGPVNGTLPPLTEAVRSQLDSALGARAAARLFQPPVTSVEGTGIYSGSDFVLAWRSGMCAHLLIRGACPRAARQVIVSETTARLTGWRIGQRITGTGWPALTVTGSYAIPRLASPYWALRAGTYFPQEQPTGNAQGSATGLDALFTAPATMTGAPASQQGTAVVDDFLRTGRVRAGDVPRLQSAMNALEGSERFQLQHVIFTTAIPGALASITAAWRSVAVPVEVITAAMLVLSWLLLFLTVTEAAEARGPEVALARLRGYGPARTLLFALSEPAVLLLAAVPAGAAAGWATAAGLSRLLLRPGTPTALPWPGWAAAVVATAGGLAAVALAARRSLRRGVVEQFRRTARVYRRGWVLDAVVLTGCAAGLIELLVTGAIGPASHSSLSLLVPGLLGLAVAVVAARLLPLACRAGYRRTARRGGLAWYLALRHIARRPGGVRSTTVLVTAFALTAFSVLAWSVEQANYQRVAATEVGAPEVLTVAVPAGKNLGAVVARADPGGHSAVAVDSYQSLSGGSAGDMTLAVDPQRFARVAAWSPGFAGQPLSKLASRLAPPAPPPVVLTGDAVRATVRVSSLSAPGEVLSANVTTGSSPVTLGALPGHGTVTLTAPLVGCPCILESLQLSLSAAQLHQGAYRSGISGSLTLARLQVHGRGGWRPAGGGALASAGAWREGNADEPPDVVTAGRAGLHWAFRGVKGTVDPTLASVNRPAALPALIPSALAAGRRGTFAGVGLDGSPLPLRLAAAVAAVPGAPGYGVIVDRHYAELAAGENLVEATQQVWLARGAQSWLVPRLKAQGVRITSVRTAAAAAAALQRQGPALAGVLFLAEAAAAALLAAAAAALGIFLSARRRRYEYAALAVTGLPRRTLRRALLAELAVVLAYGSITGLLTGVVAALLVLPDVPEFISRPAAPPLSFAPPPVPLAATCAVTAVLLGVTAALVSAALLRGVRAELLREAAP